MPSHTPPIRVDDDQPTSGQSRLVLHGRVTIGVAAEFHREAIRLGEQGRDVTVDCTTAEYLDVSAIQLLMALRRDLCRQGRSWTVVGASDALREDFRLAGLAASRGQ